MQKVIITFILLLQLTGCTHTINTWNGTQPEEYYAILGDDILPQTLADKNVTFSCKEMIYSSVGHTKKCYVKKDTAQNIDSWGKRILMTTAVAGMETVGNIVIVGFYIMIGMIQGAGSQ
jgi:hypothetical protein